MHVCTWTVMVRKIVDFDKGNGRHRNRQNSFINIKKQILNKSVLVTLINHNIICCKVFSSLTHLIPHWPQVARLLKAAGSPFNPSSLCPFYPTHSPHWFSTSVFVAMVSETTSQSNYSQLIRFRY